MSVKRICVKDVDLADPAESVQVAAGRMHSRNVGTLVVLDEERKPIGLITDRDLTIRVLAQGRDPFQTTVGNVMTKCLRTVREDTPIEEALSVMRDGPVRRVPVVDGEGSLVGLLSVDDVLRLLTDEFSQINELLEDEAPGTLSRD